MYVVATAGHVDHGKSTLVRALTGIEPDRWEEERRRGLTIDLGYAWTTLPTGETVSFVDVPGHRRFIGNMLAGLGPAPAVLLVVAADEGWRAQSTEHLAAIDALQLTDGLLVVTRTDLAGPERSAQTVADARARIAVSSLGTVAAVACSARTGDGLDELRTALARLVRSLPKADPAARMRLWIDRAFSVKGAGTVVTGTLGAGRIAVGDELDLTGDGPTRRVRVRGLHCLDQAREEVTGPARVAVNLRGVDAADVRRGDALLQPGAWLQHGTATLDVRLTRPAVAFSAAELPATERRSTSLRSTDLLATDLLATDRRSTDPRAIELPATVTLHVGTAALAVRVRPLAGDAVRLTLPRPLPLAAGDRALLRDPGSADRLDDPAAAVTGVLVVDVDPPPLRRRGAGAARGSVVAGADGRLDLHAEVGRRGHLAVSEAVMLGLPDVAAPENLVRVADRYISPAQWSTWSQAMADAVRRHATADPLDPRLSTQAVRASVGLPDLRLVAPLAAAAGLVVADGRVAEEDAEIDLGAAEAGLRRIEERLAGDPFAAPEASELAAAGLGRRQLAAAARAGRLLRLPGEIVLQPIAAAKAMKVLAGVAQPFTLSDARVALGTTRRVAVPLLEHLDERGWTRRVDAQRREVVR